MQNNCNKSWGLRVSRMEMQTQNFVVNIWMKLFTMITHISMNVENESN